MPSLTVGIATVSPAVGVTAEPLRLKVNCCAPTVQFSTPVKLPATALLKVTVVDAEPAGGTAKFNGATENSGAVGAVQTAAAAVTPGFWNAMVEVGEVPPVLCGAKVTVLPETGVEVTGTAVPAGHDSVKVTAVAVPPRFSLQVRVCVTSAAPRVQVPDSGPPLMAPVPSAVIDWPKPVNGAVGAVQVVVVVDAAPVPTPAVATAAVIDALPVEPIAPPPVNPTVEAAAGV